VIELEDGVAVSHKRVLDETAHDNGGQSWVGTMDLAEASVLSLLQDL
jgi:hypothetical protein